MRITRPPFAWVLWLSCALGSVAPIPCLGQVSDSSVPAIADGPTDDSQTVGQLVRWDETVASPGTFQASASPSVTNDYSTTGGEIQYASCIDRFIPRSNLPLPLLKRLAEDRDITLPLPLGTSFIWTELERNVAVSDIRLGLGDTPPVSVDRLSVPTTKLNASSKLARVDLWVFPFLNVYGIAGHTVSSGDVTVTVERFPFPFSPPATIDVPVRLSGTTAGWGCTTGIGGKRWFAMLDLNKTWTDFSRVDSSLTALVITPRVGLVLDRPHLKGEVHVGAMWQDTNQTVSLTLDHAVLGNDLHVEVDQIEPRDWNFLVGGMWALSERLQLIAEGGVGGRSYITSGVILRF